MKVLWRDVQFLFNGLRSEGFLCISKQLCYGEFSLCYQSYSDAEWGADTMGEDIWRKSLSADSRNATQWRQVCWYSQGWYLKRLITVLGCCCNFSVVIWWSCWPADTNVGTLKILWFSSAVFSVIWMGDLLLFCHLVDQQGSQLVLVLEKSCGIC